MDEQSTRDAADKLTYYSLRPGDTISRARYVELMQFAAEVTGKSIYALTREGLQQYLNRRARLRKLPGGLGILIPGD